MKGSIRGRRIGSWIVELSRVELIDSREGAVDGDSGEDAAVVSRRWQY